MHKNSSKQKNNKRSKAFNLNNFAQIQIGVASPEKIRAWSYGEVTKPETINYRTQKPEKDGLFCERIFGPTKDWECHCGKYKRIRYKGKVCEKCGTEVTRANVRRERMGHIELAAPVSHIWYFRGVPSRIGQLLDMTPKHLEQVIYFASYVVLDPGSIKTLAYKQVINDKELREIEEQYGDSSKTGLKVGMGAEAIRELLQAVDLEKEYMELKEIIESSNVSRNKQLKAVKRIEIVEAFRKSGNKPEWMILTVLPVLPPDLRPMLPLDGGRFAKSGLNDLYCRVINRNNLLKKLIEIGAPDRIVKSQTRMLQDAVDALIDNGRRGEAVKDASNKELKSLSGLLRGKQGRFRQNLLGKRVDYSGCAVVVPDASLKLYQCGLPKEMAVELFKPFIMKKLVESNQYQNIKRAKQAVECGKPEVWKILDKVIKEHPVILNYMPTLNKFSIQSFEPILTDGKVIRMSPLLYESFGIFEEERTIKVHVPLSLEAQVEARFLMLSTNNYLNPKNGKPVINITQNAMVGLHYLSLVRRYDGRWYNKLNVEVNMSTQGAVQYRADIFIGEAHALIAYENKEITLHDEIWVYRTVKIQDKNSPFMNKSVSGKIKTTVGRIILNSIIPQNLNFVERKIEKDYLKYEMNVYQEDNNKLQAVPINKKVIDEILKASFKVYGQSKTLEIIDDLQKLGLKYATKSGISISIFDMQKEQTNDTLLYQAEKEVDKIIERYNKGLLTNAYKYSEIERVWQNTINIGIENLKENIVDFHPIWMMINAGTNITVQHLYQLICMRGLIINEKGKILEQCIKSTFKSGLTMFEYFLISNETRKAIRDATINRIGPGYLMRRLVDVSQDVIVREDDCCKDKQLHGMYISAFKDENGIVFKSLKKRIMGRIVAEDIIDYKTGEVIVPENEMIQEEEANRIGKMVKEIEARSNELVQLLGIDLNQLSVKALIGQKASIDIAYPHSEKLIVAKGDTISQAKAEEIVLVCEDIKSERYQKIYIRSILTCQSSQGVCAKCYGSEMSTNKLVQIGEAVGIIAGQSIGESIGSYSINSFDNKTKLLSEMDYAKIFREIESIFEARPLKLSSKYSKNKGMVKIVIDDNGISGAMIIVHEDSNKKMDQINKQYPISIFDKLFVKDGDMVQIGTKLFEKIIHPQLCLELLEINAMKQIYLHILQNKFCSQGVDINDKHIEIIVRQMLRKVLIENSGDTELLPGELIDMFTFEEENKKIIAADGRPATAKRKLLGITKAALATDSFLSAASFQETARY